MWITIKSVNKYLNIIYYQWIYHYHLLSIPIINGTVNPLIIYGMHLTCHPNNVSVEVVVRARREFFATPIGKQWEKHGTTMENTIFLVSGGCNSLW